MGHSLLTDQYRDRLMKNRKKFNSLKASESKTSLIMSPSNRSNNNEVRKSVTSFNSASKIKSPSNNPLNRIKLCQKDEYELD